MARRILGLLVFLTLCSTVYAQEVIVDFKERSVPVLNEELRKIKNTISGLQEVHTFKAHRIATMTFDAPNTWQDVYFDDKVGEESIGLIDYQNSGTVIENTSVIAVRGITDILGVQGCTRPLWTGAAGTSVIVATRIMYSNDNGATWIESRCLQAVETHARGVDAADTVPFHGTIKTNGNTLIKLQAEVSSTNMTLAGYSGFDNPVAATIEIRNLGTRS